VRIYGAMPCWGAMAQINPQFNLPGVIAVRDFKDPTGPALVFTPAEWQAFVGGVKDGEFDL